MREYDVPLDAFSLDGELYAFFTSNHFGGTRRWAARAGPGDLRLLAIEPARRRRPIGSPSWPPSPTTASSMCRCNAEAATC